MEYVAYFLILLGGVIVGLTAHEVFWKLGLCYTRMKIICVCCASGHKLSETITIEPGETKTLIIDKPEENKDHQQ